MAESEKEAGATAVQQHSHNEHHDTDEAIRLAHDVDTTYYSPWSPYMLRFYMILVCAYLCGCLNGYDGSLMGGLNGMTAYQHYFDM
jgi:hypothetical protein